LVLLTRPQALLLPIKRNNKIMIKITRKDFFHNALHSLFVTIIKMMGTITMIRAQAIKK